MEQVLHLRGADIRVRWLLVECREPALRALGGPRAGRLAARRSSTASWPSPRARASSIENEFQPPFGAARSARQPHA